MTEDSISDLVRKLSPGLGSYLERMAGDPATAQDLLQESLIKISAGLSRFEGRSSLKTWAYAIATRVAIDHARRPDSKRRTIAIDETREPVDPNPDVSETFVIDEMNTCIREIIGELPEDYRAALILHDLHGLTAKETAVICGTSLATAKIRIYRGRKRLETALESACDFYRRDGVLRCDRKPSADRDRSTE